MRCGFDTVKARDIDRIGVQGIIDRLKERVGDTLVYISVDIDVLDPAFAPGQCVHTSLCCCSMQSSRKGVSEMLHPRLTL